MGSKNYKSWLVLVALGGNLAACVTAVAQETKHSSSESILRLNSTDFTIPSGSSLSSALLAFGQQSGLQLIAPSKLTAGLSTTGVMGRYQPDEALRKLLSGTSLAFKYVSVNTIQIYSIAATPVEGAEVLGAVQVEGAVNDADSVSGGVNGSQDVTATEGSGSLNSSILTLGSKGPTSIKETPQSVSVITQESMQQQNIYNLNDAMTHATGVTTQQGSDSRSTTFYSRGYQITNMQIDGGSPIDISGNAQSNYRFQPSFDMSLYDHVEVLRGADGLFNGNSSTGPGGTINLVRKKPLDHYQTVLESSVGSWNNYRNMLDVSGPLDADGKVRARGVLTWNNRDFFYDTAHDDNKIAFGSLEIDLTPTTLFNVGGSYSRMRGTPWYNGLMVYANGSDPHLPRNTGWTYPWEKADSDTTEIFTSIQQKFGENWDAKLNYTRLSQKNDMIEAEPIGTVPLDGSSVSLYSAASRSQSSQDSFDLTLNGKFYVFDLPQKITIGGNWQRIRSKITAPGDGSDGSILPSDLLIDPFHWDTSYPEPVIPASNYMYSNLLNMTQWGIYSRFQITPWKPLHFTFGMRLNSYRSYSLDNTPGEDTDGVWRTLKSITNDSDRSFEKPYYAISFDINDNWTWYGSYTDIYTPQLSMIGLNGVPIKPITGSNYETGIKYARPDGMMNASVALYRTNRQGVGQEIVRYDSQTGQILPSVDLGGGRTGYYKNSTEADISQGVDLEITGKMMPWWQMSLGYTYSISKGSELSTQGKGKPLQTFIPKHTIKLWNDFHFSDYGDMLSRFQFGLGVQAQSASYTVGDYCTDDFSFCGEFNFKSGFYSVFSARIAYEINKNWSVALRGDNLLDRNYYQTTGSFNGGFWYGEPRNFMLTLTGKFQ
ncbi:TonB-dependent siderophore receptor [Brenneria uluponensis]|uniref:TonB-dependent siderophore receptor n=1 Tax=Brenneria uluponensis TaxID=3057057 RepID=UPI0028EFF49C|nr:TonB-dependent siderophore receptor [Brenneria ulupoensis]